MLKPGHHMKKQMFKSGQQILTLAFIGLFYKSQISSVNISSCVSSSIDSYSCTGILSNFNYN